MADHDTHAPVDAHLEKYGVTVEEVKAQRAAHADKSPEDLAYDAGRNAANDNLARAHGVNACPFGEGAERKAWLKGFADVLDQHVDIDKLKKDLAEARNA